MTKCMGVGGLRRISGALLRVNHNLFYTADDDTKLQRLSRAENVTEEALAGGGFYSLEGFPFSNM
jgi:hypothetical protein